MLDSFPMRYGPAATWEQAQKIYEAHAVLYGKQHPIEWYADRGGWAWDEVAFFWTEAERMGWIP